MSKLTCGFSGNLVPVFARFKKPADKGLFIKIPHLFQKGNIGKVVSATTLTECAEPIYASG